jgi:hypothetical protein
MGLARPQRVLKGPHGASLRYVGALPCLFESKWDLPGLCASPVPRNAYRRHLREKVRPRRASASNGWARLGPPGLCATQRGPAVHSQGMVRSGRVYARAGGAPAEASVLLQGSAPPCFCEHWWGSAGLRESWRAPWHLTVWLRPALPKASGVLPSHCASVGPSWVSASLAAPRHASARRSNRFL